MAKISNPNWHRRNVVQIDDDGNIIEVATNAKIDELKTNTTPLVTSGGGGYVRQDSTGTIAKESGGNLASLLAAVSRIECLSEFNKTVADIEDPGTPEKITESSSVCKFVHISAPFNTVTQTAKNTSVVLVGSSADAGKRLRKLHPSDIDGFDFPCTDPSEVYIEAFTNGDGVDVQVFGVPA